MGINLETAIHAMEQLRNQGVRYSMYGSRTGTDGTADCSGAIYACLRKAGASDAGWVLNTDSMHAWLEKNGFQLIAQNKEWTAKRGDIVIFGKKGASGGAAGHVVLFINNTQIIHCNYTRNGVTIDNESTTCPYNMGWYVYRLAVGSAKSSSQSATTKGGKTVTIAQHATHYSPSSNHLAIPAWLKGKSYPVLQKRSIKYSRSSYEYLLGGIMSWVLSQDIVGGETISNSSEWRKENGHFRLNTAIKLRTGASTSAKEIATVSAGSVVKYDAYKIDANGYVWIRQRRGNGYGYMATGTSRNGKRVDYWGRFY